MKRIYETPQVEEVEMKNAPVLLAGSDPEQQSSGDDGEDGEGL